MSVRSERCEQHAPKGGWKLSARNKSRPSNWSSLRGRVLARDRFTCQRCGIRENLQVDHIKPVSKGGSWGLENLWVLCGKCHALKTYHEDRRPS
ncbi:HNH endonuclease [Streptomyces sp. BI20]|uniref:HNH endonuclease n=1 Tax=Streptomyces sp. BI20 TaxID=3403460 RepID=UPI003C706B21